MAAPAVTNTVLENSAFKYVVRCQATFGTSQETNVVKVDPTTGWAHLLPGSTPRLLLTRVDWTIAAAGHVLVKFAATSPATAKDMTGSGTYASVITANVPLM